MTSKGIRVFNKIAHQHLSVVNHWGEGDVVCYLRKWGFPVKLPLSLYIFFVVLFLAFSFLSLELHYLQSNEGLTSSFDEFKSSTFTAIKIFVIIHRFLYLLSNESSLRKTCKILKKRLKFEQNEELDDAELAEGLEDDLQVEKLRFELDETENSWNHYVDRTPNYSKN
ncbi:uncharacterized protein CEXT_398851 [Caerostris extrusa]|uniref:Uncharacterized protein n=1 Tax=Caerostris extrusa TaxID=172846 RepID=A0AAV4PPQ4_CAEEX|nr:uncharacterized protein CEXT_398851 [Caerostris extrusa]